MSVASEDFNFDQWVEESHINRESAKALRTHKMTDFDCLTNIKSGEVKRAGLALGQEVFLRMALAKLGNPNFVEEEVSRSTPATPVRTPVRTTLPAQDINQSLAQDPLLSAGAQLDELFKDSPDVTRALSAVATPAPLPSAYDPRILLSARATTKKAEKIISFLPEKAKDRIQRSRKDRMILTQGEDGSISVKSNDKESFYISLSEWGAANMRLMNHLLQNGDLPRDHVEYYLAYTMQVFELADIYEWASVLQFDGRYRELQAEHGFVLGDMRLYQQMQVLTPKNAYNARPRHNGMKQPKIDEDCKKWLATNGKCPFGTNCRFVHRSLTSAKND